MWDRLTGWPASSGTPPLPPLPRGTGPLVWLRLDRKCAVRGGAPAQLAAALVAARPGLRLLITHPDAAVPDEDAAPQSGAISRARHDPFPDPGPVPEALRAFIQYADPAVVLSLGSDLSDQLLIEADRQAVPVLLAEPRLPHPEARHWPWQRPRPRGALSLAAAVMVATPEARETAIRLGATPDDVTLTGPLTETRRPPGCAEAERVALATSMRGRQSWFAVTVPEAEETAVLDAHRAALGLMHRTLLILAPADPARCTALAEIIDTSGLTCAIRSQIDEPPADLQVLLADDPGEFGLWYRLASVSYLGGTLSGQNAITRDPFEAAALGSAILHGPHTAHDQTAWADLRAARAAREVPRAPQLGMALDDLLQPDRAADYASRAWAVSTVGAAVAQRIASAVVQLLPPA